MRILLIDVNYGVGSTGKIVKDLKVELEKQGHEVLACYGRGKKVKEKNVIKFGYDLETIFHAFLSRIIGIMGYFSYFSTKKLLKEIDKFNPDIVHIHETHSYFVNHLNLIEYLKKKKIKTVWTFHCEYMYTGNCGHAYECNKWKKECKKCQYIRNYPKSLFFDFTNKMFNDKKSIFKDFNNLTIVTPSQWLADRVKESFLSKKNIKIIHNGINTEIFRYRENKHLRIKHNIGNKKVILGVAPDIMSESKGGKWIVQLAREVNQKEFIFILIGVKNLKVNFPSNIICLPIIKDQVQLAEYYSLADLFLICSKKENYPTTCLEAQACKTFLLGFDNGGTKETSIYKENIFCNQNYDDLYMSFEKMINLGYKPSLETEEIEKLSKKRMLLEYMELYENINGKISKNNL